MIKFSYDKPKNIKDLENQKIKEILKDRKIYIQEKIDGSLSDKFNECCINLNDDFSICFFGEKMNIKDFHIIQYTRIPAKRIIFDVAIIKKNKQIYLPPKIAAISAFYLGMIFVPIIYAGNYLSLQKTLEDFINERSIFENRINPKLLEILEEKYKNIFLNKKNFREGIVIKSYSKKSFINFKKTNYLFEELLKKYPREKYQNLYVPNIIKPYSQQEFENYWKEYIFKPLKLKISNEDFETAYINYSLCYNKESVKECLDLLDQNYIKKVLEKFLYNDKITISTST